MGAGRIEGLVWCSDVIGVDVHAVVVHLNMVEAWSLFGPWI